MAESHYLLVKMRGERARGDGLRGDKEGRQAKGRNRRIEKDMRRKHTQSLLSSNTHTHTQNNLNKQGQIDRKTG